MSRRQERSVSYNKRLREHLGDSGESMAYLKAVLSERDPRLVLKALAKVVGAIFWGRQKSSI
jgi:DNA-binding phage protein